MNRYANAVQSPVDDHTTVTDAAAAGEATSTTESPVVAKPKTIEEKIEAATAAVITAQDRLAALLKEQARAGIIDSLKAGVVVTFDFGRAEKKRTLTGTIVAVGDDEKLGRMLAVQTGEGLDIQTLKIRAVDAQPANPNEVIANEA